jgi:hypothetical protein
MGISKDDEIRQDYIECLKNTLNELMAIYKSEEAYAIKNGNRRDQWEMHGARQAIRRVKIDLGIDNS